MYFTYARLVGCAHSVSARQLLPRMSTVRAVMNQNFGSHQLTLEHHDVAISSLGDDLRFELIKPVLAGCSPETLSRLENTSPVRQSLPKTPPAVRQIINTIYLCHVTEYYK